MINDSYQQNLEYRNQRREYARRYYYEHKNDLDYKQKKQLIQVESIKKKERRQYRIFRSEWKSSERKNTITSSATLINILEKIK